MYQIPATVLESAISYVSFRELSQKMTDEGYTSGPNQSPIMIRYTEINDFRMKRLDRTTKILPEAVSFIQSIDQPLLFLSITEAWCGDGAQILPVIEKLAQLNDKIEHKLIFRDEHPEVMDHFLTNGARSIPVIIMLDANTGQALGKWGPRPKQAQKMIMDSKAVLAGITDEKEKEQAKNESQAALQSWYAKDKTRSIQREFLDAMKNSLQVKVPI